MNEPTLQNQILDCPYLLCHYLFPLPEFLKMEKVTLYSNSMKKSKKV